MQVVGALAILLIGYMLSREETRLLHTPEPLVAMESLTDFAIVILIQAWVKASEYWPTLYGLNAALERLFETQRLGLAYPHHVVHALPSTPATLQIPMRLKQSPPLERPRLCRVIDTLSLTVRAR